MSERRDPMFFVLEPSTGYTKYQHGSIGDAKTEARRLANTNPGREFLVLEARCGFRSVGMETFWFESPESQQPF